MNQKEQLTKEEAILFLRQAQSDINFVIPKADAIRLIASAGNVVGYKPTFRCLVMGKSPEESVRWK